MKPKTFATICAACLLMSWLPLAAQTTDRPSLSSQVEVFTKSLEVDGESCDLSSYDGAIDVDQLVGRALRGLELEPAFRRGILDGASGAMNFGGQICAVLERSGGSFELLHLRQQSGRYRAMYRLLYSSGGFNYHDLRIAVDADGELTIEDIFIFSAGEWLSSTLRRSFLPAIAELGEVGSKGLGKEEREYIKALERVRKAAEFLQQGKYHEALAVHDSLPAAVRSDRNLMLQRLFIASEMTEEEGGEERYRQSLIDLQQSYPEDPALDILMIDRYVYAEDYAKVLELTDRVDRAVGGDPYLDLLRANMYMAMGKPELAQQHAARVIEFAPHLQDPYWLMVTYSLGAEDWPAAAGWLTRIEQQLGIELNDLQGVEGYEGFVQTEAYRQWLAGRS